MSFLTPETARPRPPGTVEWAGQHCYVNTKGAFVPVHLVDVEDRLQDELVRRMIDGAVALHAQIAEFKTMVEAEIVALTELLAQEYGAQRGGAKGNMTLRTIDGLLEVRVQRADRIEFGPQLQIGKALLDECLNDWASDARPELKTIVNRAFNVDKEGQVNKAELFMLLRLDIPDDRWRRAMAAIKASIRVVGSKGYVRFYRRATVDSDPQAIVLDIAKVGGVDHV